MRGESTQNREAWTALVEGRPTKKRPKYGNVNLVKEGGYASKHEAEIAAKLDVLERGGKITDLREQVPITLVHGKDHVHGIIWVADFVFTEDGVVHYLDAKGCKTPVYKLKKRLAYLLLNLKIEEV